MDMDGAHTPKSLPMGPPVAARSAAPYRLAAVSPDAAANAYHDWLARWFFQDHSRLDEFYRAIGPLPGS